MSESTAEKERLKKLLRRARKMASISEGMFPAQLEAFRYLAMEPHARGAVRTPRRGGKTTLILRVLQYKALSKPGAICAYITGSKDAARRITWKKFEQDNARLGLGGRFYRQSLEIHYPNGGAIYLMGVDRDDIVDRMRGLALSSAFLDEVDYVRNVDVENYIYSVLEPALADERGSLGLVSTPKKGYDTSFFGRASSGKIQGFRPFKWTMMDNPYTAEQMRELLAKRLAANPNFLGTQTYLNEFCGEYAADTENAVFPSIDQACVPSYELKHNDKVVIGLLPNFYGETSLAVLAWSAEAKMCVILESFCFDYRDLDDVVQKLTALLKIYPIARYNTRIIGSFSDRMSLEHIRNRFGLPVREGMRSDRVQWINQFNMDLDSGLVKVVKPRNDSLLHQTGELWWLNVGAHRSSDKFNKPSSLAFAMLQAYEVCYHYREIEKTAVIKKGTPEYDQKLEEQFIAQLEHEHASGGRYS